jgi:hypothetical protein
LSLKNKVSTRDKYAAKKYRDDRHPKSARAALAVEYIATLFARTFSVADSCNGQTFR